MSAQVEKIALFIDGANLYATAKSLGFDIDYKRLLREFQSRGNLLRAFYYTAVIEDQEYSSIRPLIDWLDYNGYTVVTKATKEFVDQTGRRKVKGNMDIELAVDAMELAPHIDHMVLFSGDGDFRSLVEAVQRRGVRVTVISTISTQPPMVADELRRQADVFLDIVELQSKIGRDPSERAAARAARRRAPAHAAIPAARPAVRSAPAATTSRTDRARRQRPDRASLAKRPLRWRLARLRGMPEPGRFAGKSSRLDRQPPCRNSSGKPGRDCPRCPRLVAFREEWRAKEPSWFNAPVPSFGPLDARLLIVGLAPGLRGANRTGRPFTGDYAGDLLYATLKEYGFARGAFEARPDDTLELIDARITNGVRCVPPENKPTPAEINTCRDFLKPTIAEMPKLRAIVTLGRIAHETTVRTLGAKLKEAAVQPRRHGADRRARAVQQLSLLALQHQHRRADAGDVPRGVRGGARLSRRLKPAARAARAVRAASLAPGPALLLAQIESLN